MTTTPVPRAKRAFIMVWDGMRPDLISAELTPNLASLAARGVRFLDSHAVFPTVTRVNSASLSTGAWPAEHGIAGNTVYAPGVDARAPISIGDHHSLYALIESRGGRLVPCDTLADRVAEAGDRTVVVSTGSPGSAFLCHPRVRECPGDRLFNPAIMLPRGAGQELVDRLGPIPASTIPNTERDAYFARAIAEYVLPELDPRLLIYWHTDPDVTQHRRGLGSPDSMAAIRNADTNLGLVLAVLDGDGRMDEMVVAVVSDHGYASIDPAVEAQSPLVAAGLGVELEAGRLILSNNGLSLFANVPDGDSRRIERVARALQAWEYAGPVFSGARGQPTVQGTLPMPLVGVDGELAPDVLCTLVWNDAPNQYGLGGRSAGLTTQYLATHGGISPWEVRNTFILAGAGVKVGLEDPLPAGNLDLVPTLVHLLGLDSASSPSLTGRVLAEALNGGPEPGQIKVRQETVGAERDGYRASLRFSLAGGARYLDFGWAERESS